MNPLQTQLLDRAQRALDDRQPIPAWVRRLAQLDADTAQQLDQLEHVDATLQATAQQPPQAQRPHPSTPPPTFRFPASNPNPFALGSALAAALTLATAVGLLALQSQPHTTHTTHNPLAKPPNSTPTPTPTFTLQLPDLPNLQNPLDAPARAVRAAFQPALAPNAAFTESLNQLGQQLEAPFRQELAALAADLDAVVRLALQPAHPAPDHPSPAPSTPAQDPNNPDLGQHLPNHTQPPPIVGV